MIDSDMATTTDNDEYKVEHIASATYQSQQQRNGAPPHSFHRDGTHCNLGHIEMKRPLV